MTKEITYKNEKYKISDLQYPEDLDTSDEYGRNKVVFLINVTAAGKFAEKRSTARKEFLRAQAKASNTAFDESTYADDTVRDFVRDETATSKSVGAAVDFIGESSLPSSLKVLNKMKRLTSAISLYIPNDLSIGYSVAWGEEDLSSSELLAETLGGMVAAAKNKSATEGATEAVGAAATGVGTKLGSTALNNVPALAKALRATPGNAKAEQLFKSVDFRTFTFNYSFAPRDKKEAETVLRIIRTFRHHMLPEFADENKFIYVYPSEFEVKYFRGDKENEYLEKHLTAVLTNCNINYTPNGQFVTFGGDLDGMPAQINMTLTFKEISLPSKETSPDNESGI
jgi:hypothetical protein